MRSIIQNATPHLVDVSENAECADPSTSSVCTETKVMKRRRATVELAGARCGHVCPQHPVTTLDPAVWDRLPEALLELIFARLPLPEICRLRTLSQHWNRSLYNKSRFSSTCAEVIGNMFALVEEDRDDFGKFWVKLYDVHTDKWHVYPLYVGDGDPYLPDPYVTMSASDGGLVVFVSTYRKTKEKPLQIEAVNPLTRSTRVLPIEGVKTHQLQMVQIITDSSTGHYKVILVGHHKKLNTLADVHFSEQDEWVSMSFWLSEDRPPPQQFFGIKYNWDLESLLDPISSPGGYAPVRLPIGPCVYNNTDNQLTELKDESFPQRGVGLVRDCALVKDRLFVLHEERVPYERRVPRERALRDPDSSGSDDDSGDEEPLTRLRYCVTECQGQIPNPNWVRVRSISGDPFIRNPMNAQYSMELQACRGFLLVVAYNDELFTPYEHEVGWLYDLDAGQWRVLNPKHHTIHDYDDFMVELRWDTDPDIEADPNAPKLA